MALAIVVWAEWGRWARTFLLHVWQDETEQMGEVGDALCVTCLVLITINKGLPQCGQPFVCFVLFFSRLGAGENNLLMCFSMLYQQLEGWIRQLRPMFLLPAQNYYRDHAARLAAWRRQTNWHRLAHSKKPRPCADQ